MLRVFVVVGLFLVPVASLATAGPDEAPELVNDIAVTGSFSGTGATLDYVIDVPSGQDHAWFRLRAEPTPDDYDLFVRRDAPASRAAHDWSSHSGSSDETLHLTDPAGGRYHVNLESYRGAGPFTLTVTFGTVAPATTWHGGADTTAYWAYSDARRAGAIDSSRAGHLNTVFVDGKTSAGAIAWSTDAWPRVFAFADGDSPVERVVRDAALGGEPLKVAVRYATFHDKHAAFDLYPSARISGTEWLDPGCAATVDHVIAQLLDMLAATDVDEVNLDFVRYPSGSQVSSSAALPCTGGTYGSPARAKTQVVAEAVERIYAAVKAAHPSVVVSGDLFGYSCTAPVTSVGHDAYLLSKHLDVVMPMLYPTGFSGNAAADPYGTVKTATERCIAQTLSAEQVKPWIQGFDSSGYVYETAAQVNRQVDAVREAGGSGAVVWWFPSMGTAPATWAPVAAHMPADWTTRAEREPLWFEHGFEHAPGPFTVDDASGPGSWTRTLDDAASGRRAMHAGDGETYAPNSVDHLVTRSIDLTDAQAPELRFQHRADGESGCFVWLLVCWLGEVPYDYGRVQVSENGGAWTTVLTDVVTTSGWDEAVVDLAQWGGSADVRVRFTWTSDASVERGGWTVDDVRVADAAWFT